MENFSLLLIFWYGILHAFGPDHLTAIADFSIGKNRNKTILITFLFAIGHGLTLLIFAKILSIYIIDPNILAYADVIASSVIVIMGIYLLYMVYTKQININKHIHNNKEHIHIYFGKVHKHSNKDLSSSFTIGTLMGIGGTRGMLVSLGLINAATIDLSIILAFTAGVMLIFIMFGLFISFINENFLKTQKNVNGIFIFAGFTSLAVGLNMLLF